MKPKMPAFRSLDHILYGLLAVCCAFVLVPGAGLVLAQQASQAGAAQEKAALLPPEQLDSLVAPIALYPDALLAQTLVAATYPLEIIQLQQWLAKNPGLKDKALADAVAKQPWDPSVQTMSAIPDVVKRLADDVQWTTELGNAFLAQQSAVMDAVQRMRAKAVDKGALAPNEQQKVETQTVAGKTVIVVESANPEVVYVPSYSPTVVYGASVYPYPPIYYPYYAPGAAFVAFSFGVMAGAAWGGYCCNVGWGGNDIDINVDNNFNRNSVNRGGGSGKWQHDPQHRGGAPYADRATASKYGGSARGDSLSSRQASASPQAGRQQSGSGNVAGNTGTGGRSPGDAGARTGSPSTMDRSAGGAGDYRGGGAQPDSRDAGASSRPNSGFSGGSSGYNGSSARASSSRGASSMGGRGGGGRRR